MTDHQAIHGGGNWKLARKEWPEGEWNTMLMARLKDHEHALGRKLGRDDILAIAREELIERGFADRPFIHYKARK